MMIMRSNVLKKKKKNDFGRPDYDPLLTLGIKT